MSITERLIPASASLSSASRVVAEVSPLLTRPKTSSSPRLCAHVDERKAESGQLFELGR